MASMDDGQLRTYLDRVGLDGPVPATAEGLKRVHHAQLDSIPYENVDIQLGVPLRLDVEGVHRKMVVERKGGFCYEQNVLLAAALRAMGFEVEYLKGAVGRAVDGDGEWFNHMPLLVGFGGRTVVADTGLGTGFRDPFPVEDGPLLQGQMIHHLSREDGAWRFRLDRRLTDQTFDFTTDPRGLDDFLPKFHELQDSPESPFVKTLAVMKTGSRGVEMLRARTLTVYRAGEGKRQGLVESRDDFAAELRGRFGLELSGERLAALWDRAAEQHEAWRAEKGQSSRSLPEQSMPGTRTCAPPSALPEVTREARRAPVRRSPACRPGSTRSAGRACGGWGR
ncbi:arylamine N-acetyltransferase family protein [Salininema proteolyticum]|uniref:Arylamine N-acetyltransferase n=1 Tax=Salininema proteolyticum TaxID=1607685 RepID=A0ABV8TVD0_9ACTN